MEGKKADVDLVKSMEELKDEQEFLITLTVQVRHRPVSSVVI